MDDTIYRQAAIDAVCEMMREYFSADDEELDAIKTTIGEIPATQSPLEEFEWCTDCKEYDQKAHCCHRYTKVIRQTVEELKAQPQRMRGRWIRHKDWVSEGYCEYTCSECDMGVDAMYNYCPRCGAYMREGEQDE